MFPKNKKPIYTEQYFLCFSIFYFYDLRSDQATVMKYPRHKDCSIYNSLPSPPQKAVFCEILTVFANFTMKYAYHWSYSEYLTFLIIFSQGTSRNLHLTLSLWTSKELQIKTLSFLVSPTHTVFVIHSFGGAKNMSEKENTFYKSRFSEYFHSFQFSKVTVLKSQLFFWWTMNASGEEKNHLIIYL